MSLSVLIKFVLIKKACIPACVVYKISSTYDLQACYQQYNEIHFHVDVYPITTKMGFCRDLFKYLANWLGLDRTTVLSLHANLDLTNASVPKNYINIGPGCRN